MSEDSHFPKTNSRASRLGASTTGLTLKGRALAYLARREYSRVELKRKLMAHAESEIQLEALLDELEAQSWLSAQRFTDSMLRRQAPRLGSARVLHELKKHQLDESLISEARTLLQENETERAYAVWKKKFGHKIALANIEPQQRAKERAKQIRFLLMRGFTAETATTIVDNKIEYNEQ